MSCLFFMLLQQFFFHILQKWQNNQDIVGIHIMCNKMAAL